MKTLPFFLFIITFLVTGVQAQSVDDIINKHIEAIGGKDKLNAVNSVYLEVSSSAMGSDLSGTVIILKGKGYKSESVFNGQTIIQCITDSAGWMINPMTGQSSATPMPDELYKTGKIQINIDPLLDYAAHGIKVTLLGTENVGNANAYKLKLTTPDSIDITYFIDSATYYTTKTITTAELMGQQVDVSTVYSNFKKLDFGITIPFTYDTDLGGQFSYTTNVTKAEINNPVDTAIFNMPKQ